MEARKMVVVLNKRFELAQMMSAIGHVSVGLGASQPVAELSLVAYKDSDGDVYPNISDWSFVVLRAGSGQLRTLKAALDQAGRPAVCYTDTMFAGGSDAQQEATSGKSTNDVEIVALATFGPVEVINNFTRKFSVWPR